MVTPEEQEEAGGRIYARLMALRLVGWALGLSWLMMAGGQRLATNAFALVLPGMVLVVGVLCLLVRCPRCGRPAERRRWIWGGILAPTRCVKCGLSFRAVS